MRQFALLLLLVACAKKDAASGGACKDLTVTVDGTPLPAMPHGLAKANNMNGDISYEVDVFNHDKTTCDMLLDKSGRQIPEGEVSVRAFAAGAGMTGKGVAISAHTQMGGNVTLASPPPKAVGDVVKVCVDNVSFKPIAGDYKDKQVVVNGRFVGTYCGEMKW
ncbi:MAG TPA: hypothetical protein VFV99_20010 [Kofleriaceae bacterium]|nr:hypothetical protein [Kofleriaceae bacterium]